MGKKTTIHLLFEVQSSTTSEEPLVGNPTMTQKLNFSHPVDFSSPLQKLR